MMNLDKLSFRFLAKIQDKLEKMVVSKWIFLALIVVSFIGFLDASYLTVKHYLGTPLDCSIIEGCEEVATSQYAVIFNVPVALLGAIFYLLVFILSILYLDTKNSRILLFMPLITAVGFLASVWFIYLQLFVIGAICIYCMISAATSIILFILSLLVLKELLKD